MRIYTTFLVTLSVSLATFACAKKDKGGGGPSGGTPPPNDPGPEVDGIDPAAGPQTPGPAPAPVGTIKIDLSGATAVGVAEIDKSSQLKDANGNVVDPAEVGTVAVTTLTEVTSAKTLTKVLADGSLVALPFKNEKDSEIEKIIPVGAWGVVIQFTGMGPFMATDANLWWIDAKKDGEMRPINRKDGTDLRTNLGSRVEFDEENGDLYAVLNGSLFRFNFATETLEQLTDGEQVIDKFVRLTDGSLYFDGRLKSNNAQILRRLKGNGGFENFLNDYGYKVLENFGSVGRRGVIGSRIFEVVSDKMHFHFLPGSLNHNISGGKDAPVVGNNWLISYMGDERRAFNLTEDKVAGNPWAANNGKNLASETPGVTRTNVDTAQGLYFDGANIVSVTRSGSELSSTVVKKLIYPNGTLLKVERVFGPDHGFSAEWGAYAISQDGKLYWTTINSESGLVAVDSAKKIEGYPATNMTATMMAVNSSVYKFGEKLVIFQVDAPEISELALNETSGNYELETKHETFVSGGGSGYGNMHSYAVIADGKLHAAAGSKVVVYDPATSTKSDFYPGVPWLNAGGEPEEGSTIDAECFGTRKFKALFSNPDRSKPMAIFRTCNTTGPGVPELSVVTFDDWTFSSAQKSSIIDLGLPETSSLRFLEPVRALESAETRLMFLDRVGKTLVSLNSAATARESSTLDAAKVKTNGNVRIATQFAATVGAVEVAAPWTGTSLLISGTMGSTYKSFRSDLGNRSETAVTELDGVQIYSISLNSKGTLFVNGLRTDDNKKITLRFDPDGTLLGTDETSNVKILSIQPFGE